jgi:hypothetical protein
LSTPEEKLRGNGHNVRAKSWRVGFPENDFWPTSQLAKIPFRELRRPFLWNTPVDRGV